MTHRPADRRRYPAFLAAAAAAAIALTLSGCGGDDGDSLTERQADVAERGADVMPFDLEATTHRFMPNDEGLVQEVVADDPSDQEQVDLVRAHLDEEAARFAEGDYADPASIHGDDMPGLAELEAGAADIEISNEDIPGGGRISYTTSDPSLVDALHIWAEAQVSDHGDHAEHS